MTRSIGASEIWMGEKENKKLMIYFEKDMCLVVTETDFCAHTKHTHAQERSNETFLDHFRKNLSGALIN